MCRFNFYFLLVLLCSSFLLGCNKKNPNPELLDPIYQDLLKRLDEKKKELEAEKKVLEEHEKALKAVVPQTGQIKYAEKRYWDSRHRIDALEQAIEYFEFKAASRKRLARYEYSIAFKKDQPWPDPAEYKQYMDQRKLVEIRRQWDLNTRFSQLGVQRNPSSAKKEKPKPAEH